MMAHLAAAALSALEEMSDLMTMAEERDLLLFTKEEEEFMVVPTLQDSPIRLEDLLSEANFNGLTVDIHQNPSGVFVVDVERTSSNHNSIQNQNVQAQNFSQFAFSNDQQYQYYQQMQQGQFSYGSSDNNSVSEYKSFNNDVRGVQMMDMGGYQQSSNLGSEDVLQRQFSELSDPKANWVAQTTDVTLLERLVSESERFRSVDDILDIVPQESLINPSIDSFGQQNSPVLDKKQILEEIYREAEEISSRRESPAIFTPDHTVSSIGDLSNSSTPFTIDGDYSLDSYQPYLAEKVSFDHTFGSEKKEKKSKKADDSKKEKTPKREGAKAKKRHQNREAALRYRLKKRAERSLTSEELGGLLERNEFLKNQKSSLSSEIAYLKGLLSEVNRMKKVRA